MCHVMYNCCLSTALSMTLVLCFNSGKNSFIDALKRSFAAFEPASVEVVAEASRKAPVCRKNVSFVVKPGGDAVGIGNSGGARPYYVAASAVLCVLA